MLLGCGVQFGYTKLYIFSDMELLWDVRYRQVGKGGLGVGNGSVDKV